MQEQTSFNLAAKKTKRPVFYQTTPLTVAERGKAIASAERQDQRVLAIYRCAQRPLTPSEAHQQLAACGHSEPVTSIRRAINTLTQAGILAKLEITQRGPWGQSEHFWVLRGAA